MTQAEYQAAYEAVERAIEMGAMPWKAGLAKVSLLAIEYALSELVDLEKSQAERGGSSYWRET